jgi:predicted aldo/keto reductase-like oxidoreductase
MGVDVGKLPRLGFGLMRLPTVAGGERSAVDIPRVCAMADEYMESGFNYFDTAYMYHGGQSETAAREAVVKRFPREAFYLATKLPIWPIKHKDDRDRIFNEQLERTGAGYFDFYLLHSIEDGSNIEGYEHYDCFEWGKQKKAEGKIRHFGFSYHGTPELLERVLEKHPELEFAQIQLNYADWDNPIVHSGKNYEILRKSGLPIIVMEPVKGGMLANLAPAAGRLLTDARPGDSAASWAVRFAASLPGVAVMLSGMSSEEQMRENIGTVKNLEPITDGERAILREVVAAMSSTPTVQCTDCRYCCDGCPAGIQIPEVFKALNTLRMYGKDLRPLFFYRNVAGGRAKDCTACGGCEAICPQHLKVIELMREASERLDRE